jgi:hypothetical protein
MSTVHMLYGSFILALDLLPCLAPATLRGYRPELQSVDAEAAAAKREGRCRPVCRQVLASVHACMEEQTPPLPSAGWAGTAFQAQSPAALDPFLGKLPVPLT